MKLRKVVGYETHNEPAQVLVILECGHKKPLPAGVYSENTKRFCKECQ